MRPDSTTNALTLAVRAVIAGTPLPDTAMDYDIDPVDLADAVDAYHAAGQAALCTATADWYQIHVQFADNNTAEHTLAQHLSPHLDDLHRAGLLARWWFIRKTPHWRLRFQPGPDAAIDDLRTSITALLDQLTPTITIAWRRTVYEPETLAFGGELGIDIAHDLFHADSHAILRHARRADPGEATNTLGRRELSVLLCTHLFRSAGQDWYEQADIWHRVAQMRPLPPNAPADRLPDIATALLRLTTTTVSPTGGPFSPGGPLDHALPWVLAFTTAGQRLADLARDGILQRGLRSVLAHHVIFHWNRLGLTGRTQAILAHSTRDTMMNPPTC